MRRYESKDGKRFWEVAISPAGLAIRSGDVGKTGRQSFKEMPLQEARALADKRVEAKLKAGFKLVASDEAVEARNPSLEATISESPENPAGYQIYADWLQEQGEIRGDLIALDVVVDDEARSKKIAKARRAFLKANPAYDMPARFGELARKKIKKNQSRGTACIAGWRHGFIAEAHVGVDRSPPALADLVFELFSHPSARFVQTLTIGALGRRRPFDYGPVSDQIRLGAPASLRRLFIADFDEDSYPLADCELLGVGPLLAGLPGLRVLELRAGVLGLEGLASDRLEELSITVAELTDANLAELDGMALPALQSLRIRGSGRSMPASALATLLDTPPPALTSLALTHMVDTEPLVRALLSSPLGAQLERLDLTFGTVADPALFSGRQIGHLQALTVVGNFLPDDLEPALAERVGILSFRDQRENLAGYASVTDQQVREFAPDGKSITAAKKVAKPATWPRLGREPELLWGECAGSSSYEVFVRVGESISDAACTCPSRKYPCKHALALLLLAAAGHRFPREAAPSSLLSNAEDARYESSWE